MLNMDDSTGEIHVLQKTVNLRFHRVKCARISEPEVKKGHSPDVRGTYLGLRYNVFNSTFCDNSLIPN